MAVGHDGEDAVRAKLGSLSQRGRIASYLSVDGPDSGMRTLRIRTAAGLDLDLLPDRGLDIGFAAYRGTPLSWLSGTGFGAFPAGARADDWLRAFGGGLLTTCGPDTFGRASEHAGRRFPVHGTQSGLRVEVVEKRMTWAEARVVAVGTMSSLSDDEWELRRTITAGQVEPVIRIHDVVTNRASHPAGHMVLYHVNLGWPALDEDVTVLSEAADITQVGGPAAAAGRWRSMGPPQPDADELVFRHRFEREPVVAMHGGAIGVGVRASGNLRDVFQWMYPRTGKYALGIEPASAGTLAGRADAEARYEVVTVEPDGSLEFTVELSLSASSHSS